MIAVRFDNKIFQEQMNNLIAYSEGFLEGIQMGKQELYQVLGPEIVDMVYKYIDANARISPQTLHHVYEWYSTGSPDARLFDIKYSINVKGISFTSQLNQSQSIQNGSKTPFYNKASIMEGGMAVVIRPKNSKVLHFIDNGEEVFTPDPVVVENPGGQTAGQFTKALDSFFNSYFKQSFLRTSGLDKYFKEIKTYKQDLPKGIKNGRSQGIESGFKWVASARSHN